MIVKRTRDKVTTALRLSVLSCFLFSASLSSADSISGSETEPFVAAVNAWLDGDDAQSLPQLVTLANDGNLAAQILLGRINVKGLALTPWVKALSRDEQRAIFRRMDTKFGTPWMKVAAEASELAEAFWNYRKPESGRLQTDAAMILAKLGESRAASEFLPTLFMAQQWSDVIKMADIAKATGFEPFAWAAATYEPDAEGAVELLQAGLRAAAEGSIKGELFLRHANPDINTQSSGEAADSRYVTEGRVPIAGSPTGSSAAVDTLREWLKVAPEATPFRGFCVTYCPDAVTSCVDDVYGTFYGYVRLIQLVQSPLESVISTEDFLQSKRAIALVDGLLKAYSVPDVGWLGPTSGVQECLIQALFEE